MILRVSLKKAFALSTFKVIQSRNGANVVDLSLLDRPNAEIEAVVIVNNVLNMGWAQKGIQACKNIVIADGGANKLYNTPLRYSDKIRAIVGDFDSIEPNVKEFYQSKGVELQKIEQQNTNDFQKAFTKAVENNWHKILCLGAFGGRMDHAISGMSNTTKLCRKYKDLQVLLVGRENLMYYVRPGINHEITISSDISRKGCGIIRFGPKVNVRTKGFKWNLGPENQFSSLEWGSFISTSNQIIDDTVEIQSEGDLFFTAHFQKIVY